MAGNGSRKGGQRAQDKSGINRSRNNISDELDLRDEIFELKKGLAAIRKERDRLLIRVRKCEDECRRKDRQIEQLMDPSQNSEIRRLLSMKGAALLLNLKDQNNALLHMVMEKDLQIRRLLGEVKTAKLYSKSSKTEPYRAEISRLRSLLLQSQEALKETASVPQVSTMNIPGSSSSSSHQPSPRELEELRFTIQSLETHMRYSKELLTKKNQEIMFLNNQLGKAIQHHQYGEEDLEWINTDTPDLFIKSDGIDADLEKRKLLELFHKPIPKSLEKALTEPKLKKPGGAKGGNKRNSLPDDRTLNDVTGVKNEGQTPLFSKSLKWKNGKCKESLSEGVKSTQISINGRAYEGEKKKSSGKEKWKNAVKKLRKSKRDGVRGGEDGKTDDLAGNFEICCGEKRRVGNSKATDDEVWRVLKEDMRKTSVDGINSSTPGLPTRKFSLPSSLDENTPPIPKRRTKIGESVNTFEAPIGISAENGEIITVEETTPVPSRQKLFRSLYRVSIDSSFESESGSVSRYEPKLFEVEVEINNPNASISNDSEIGSPVKERIERKDGGENFFENDHLEDDDDEDVVIM